MTDFTNSQMTGSPDDTVRILASSNAAVSHTAGATSETTLATYTLPAGTMGPNDTLRITTLWSFTNSADDKRMRISFGGSNFLDELATTAGEVSMQSMQLIRNNNSLTAQKAHNNAQEAVFTKTSGAITTAVVDTTADVDIDFNVVIQTVTETVTLESYIIELLRAV